VRQAEQSRGEVLNGEGFAGIVLSGATSGATEIRACRNWLLRESVRIGTLPIPKLDVAGSNPVARFSPPP
jgi:hypothetical protein